MDARTLQPTSPKRMIVFGHKRHGKDTACEYIEQAYGLSFASSSFYACETFLFEQMREAHGYASIQECFEDRDNHREYWYKAIRAFNDGDLCRLGRGIFEDNPIYCGIRDREEFEALRSAGLFDLAIWIDASERRPLESASSMKLCMEDADIVIDNNGPQSELPAKIDTLFATLGIPKLAANEVQAV